MVLIFYVKISIIFIVLIREVLPHAICNWVFIFAPSQIESTSASNGIAKSRYRPGGIGIGTGNEGSTDSTDRFYRDGKISVLNIFGTGRYREISGKYRAETEVPGVPIPKIFPHNNSQFPQIIHSI